MQERAVIDRIVDGRHAVLLVGKAETERVVPVDQLPPACREGDWLLVQFAGEALVAAVIETAETLRATDRVAAKLARLRERGRSEPTR